MEKKYKNNFASINDNHIRKIIIAMSKDSNIIPSALQDLYYFIVDIERKNEKNNNLWKEVMK